MTEAQKVPIDRKVFPDFEDMPPKEDADFVMRIHDADGVEILRLNTNGTITVNPKYTVDTAAKEFWNAVMEQAEVARYLGKDSQACYFCETRVFHITTCPDCANELMELKARMEGLEK